MNISLKGITKEYRNRNACVKALDNVDLEFDGAELVLITGENGCGKSTLLNIIGGLDSPTSGTISADGSRDNAGLKERAENTAYIFQTSNLIATLTVKQNIALVADKGETGIDAVIEKTGLSGLEDRFPHELSIGQQQRVCIARAIIKNDPVLLADEPTSSLDPETRKEIAGLLSELSKDRLVLVVTHYPEDFVHVDRHIVMSRGKIESDERINPSKPVAVNKKKVRKSNTAIWQSTFARIKNHALRFAINVLMLFIGIVCIVISESVLSVYNDNEIIYRQVLANDRIVIKTDDYSAFGDELSRIYLTYHWEDFPEEVVNGNTDFVNGLDSDYIKAYAAYGPYFADVKAVKGAKLAAGRMPSADNEVVINKYLADVYIAFYEKKELSSYDDVVQKAVITMGGYGIPIQQDPVYKIVGVLDDDLSAFEPLKSTNTPLITADTIDYPEDQTVLYNELTEWLKAGGGAIYAIDCGAAVNSANGYYNNKIDSATQKNKVSAIIGSEIINYDYEGAKGLENVKVYGSTDGAVLNFDKISDLSYAELCEKYDNAEDIEREIENALNKVKGTQLYFSMEYMSFKKYQSILDQMKDMFSKTYYFDVDIEISGVYIPEESYFHAGGLFSQGSTANIGEGVVLLNEDNYSALNSVYASPHCGLALLDVSGFDSPAEAKNLLTDRSVLSYECFGKYALDLNYQRMCSVNAVSLAIGCVSLVLSLIFVLYSISQYFKQYSADIGILMSLGKGKGFCCLFLLGEYLIMAVAIVLLAIPVLFIVPSILNAVVSGVATVLNVFLPSAFAYVYIAAYLVGISVTAVVGVYSGIVKKPPIDRIKDRR